MITMKFQCINARGTRYEIPATSPSADKMVATPWEDYLALQAYLNKLAQVFQKEFLSKVGSK